MIDNVPEFINNLAKLNESPRKPDDNALYGKKIHFVADEAKSEKFDLSLLPKDFRYALDNFAGRVLDPEQKLTLVVGSPFSGKSFLIEQLAFNSNHYLQKSALEKIFFIKLNDMDMKELSTVQGLRTFDMSVAKYLKCKGENICYVTESPETAVCISSTLPDARVILEINTDIFFMILMNATQSGSKFWESWQSIDVNTIEINRKELIDLLYNVTAQKLNKNFNDKITYRQVVAYVNYFINKLPNPYDDNKNLLIPPGLWATTLRYLMSNLSFLSDKDLYDERGNVIFQKVLEKTFIENEELFMDYVDKGFGKEKIVIKGMPEDLMKALGIEGAQINATTSENEGEEVSNVAPLQFKNIETLSARLKKTIMGQDEAVEKVCEGMIVPAAGLQNPNRPLRSFLFLGPTGVGKTQMALDLAKEVAKTPMHVVRIDMSEYQQAHEVAKLFGAPPGYLGHENGGVLTSAIIENPHSIVLLDEIEKAHPKVWDTLLQVLDSGRMTDSQGQTVNFTQSIIIMTSNLGVSEAHKTGSGFATKSYEELYNERKQNIEKTVLNEVKKTFRPELINRIDEIVVFNEITVNTAKAIMNREIKIVTDRMKTQGYTMKRPSNKIIDIMLNKADISHYGAREIQRIVFKNVANPAAHSMVKNSKMKELELYSTNDEILVKPKQMNGTRNV